ncbi:MAG: hypothetical protein U1A24_18760 [Cypionkella sp.]|uniref:hypothetical protein n=1 Tax=Cypionkella sp. TaxID=2811411 RepID=UPI002ABB9CF2|nr:hypothetical protein [Cypionkella sp.]MDZ4312595.1 hypothetical protein [Cypionkella sp.]MDZ4393225.1 hypothetical protein [Cypionkella sp.]
MGAIDHWQNGESYIWPAIYAALFLISAIALALIMSWALPVAVVEQGGITVPAVYAWGSRQMIWSDLIDVKLTKRSVRLRCSTRNGGFTLFWIRRAECETKSYRMMLKAICQHRPDLLDAKAAEVGTV